MCLFVANNIGMISTHPSFDDEFRHLDKHWLVLWDAFDGACTETRMFFESRGEALDSDLAPDQ